MHKNSATSEQIREGWVPQRMSGINEGFTYKIEYQRNRGLAREILEAMDPVS